MNILGKSIVAISLFALPATGFTADTEQGKALYKTYCAQCHGVLGNGKGINAAQLSVQPRNHTDRAEMSARSDEELFKAIKFGGQAVNKSILMPNWDGNLKDNEINDIIAYMRQLCCQAVK